MENSYEYRYYVVDGPVDRAQVLMVRQTSAVAPYRRGCRVVIYGHRYNILSGPYYDASPAHRALMYYEWRRLRLAAGAFVVAMAVASVTYAWWLT